MLAVGQRLAKTKPKKQTAPIIDYLGATTIRVDRGDVDQETEIVRGVGTLRRDVVRSRLWRAWRNHDLTDDQYRAGERFALTVERSAVSVRSMLGRDTPGMDGDPQIISNGNWRRAKAGIELRAAGTAVGPVLLPVLCWVAIDGRPADGWAASVGKPARHGMAALCLALDALVDHWRPRR